MRDFDSIRRTQDEIRTVVNAVLGESIWNLSYNDRRMAIELELTKYLEEEKVLFKRLCDRSMSGQDNSQELLA